MNTDFNMNFESRDICGRKEEKEGESLEIEIVRLGLS